MKEVTLLWLKINVFFSQLFSIFTNRTLGKICPAKQNALGTLPV